MVDFTVTQRGTDSSGRGVFLTNYAWSWWDGLLWELELALTITQAGWQLRNGGGAAASAGYHDKDAIDIRVWDLTPDEIQLVIRTARANGAMAWLRGPTKDRGGMDPHIHIGIGGSAMAPGLQSQWWDYQHGGNGLTGTSAGPDYHWRPEPLVTRPPKGFLMPSTEEIVTAIKKSEIETVDGPLSIGRVLARTYNRVTANQDAAKEISKALAAAGIEADAGVVQQAVETGLRNVLGSLDKKE